MNDPVVDVTGSVIVELQTGLRALRPVVYVALQVRGGRFRGDSPPSVVLVVNNATPDVPGPSAALWRYIARCYGADERLSSQLAADVVTVMHRIGPRIRSSDGAAIYQSRVRSFGQPGLDPDTRQPLESVVIEVSAALPSIAT